jgi:hypothetical protein
MKSFHNANRDRETLMVAQIAAGISILSFLIYFQRGDLLLYGDAVAHINIARRVFDSKTPGLLQLGTVWLPLPHLLMVPFLFSNALWRSGVGGSIPSMIAYVLSVAGIFRLVRGALACGSEPDAAARITGWFAAGIYAANPNLIYLQSTAMTEPLYLALFIWAVVYFTEFAQPVARDGSAKRNNASLSLIKCGWCLVGACFTRYDGWFLAVTLCLAAFWVWRRTKRDALRVRRSFGKFVLLSAAAPILWLAYNAAVYRNPLEFANGPYSARAVEQKTATPESPSHPGASNLPVAFSFFLKSAELNVATADAVQKLWLGLLLLGSLMTVVFDPRLWPLLLLWVPLPFYMLSISYSGVPIFLPVWWPHSYYNLRYGLELLPASAVFVALAANFAMGLLSQRPARTAIGVAFLLLVAGSYLSIWKEQPVCFREAWVNSRDRMALETELSENLEKLPRDSTLLMYLGDHVGALQMAGIRLNRVVSEGNHRPWKKPSDADGLWERALANPRQYVDYVVASNGDAVATAVQKRELSEMVVIHGSGERPVTIYWTHQ